MNKAELVKKVRQITSFGVLECKQALEASDWDVDAAVQYCKEHARPANNKPVGAGAIFSYVHHNQAIASLIELHCATDFVVKSEFFQQLGNELAIHIAAMSPENVEELLKQETLRPRDHNATIKDLVNDVSLKVNEPIKIARFQRYILGV